ncbi:hypothetical protein CTRI78_v003621 [Colletotrichum trifolii]|uniref:BTB domain-containing protein n=1 Tax=Colletotrichum trifolii TaxID=5466 RepID=A0A4R8RMG2_COLTR|nr:hypothetical protein CTRI78_v003621 [Colletotrichum trifolii]
MSSRKRAADAIAGGAPRRGPSDAAPSNSSAAASKCGWAFVHSAKESLSCGSAFYFDPRGDLILSVGEAEDEVNDFVVCSRTVARGSKVFDAMLFGGFAESAASALASDGSWTVKLPDDQMAPFFLVLTILHGNFQLVPRTLEEAELYELLVVTEKYDMTHVLRPWAKRWFNQLAIGGVPHFQDRQRGMWIAWELGREDVFCNLAKELMLSSCVDDAGQLLSGDDVPLCLSPFHEPPDALVNQNVYGHEYCDPWTRIKKELESLVDNVPAPVAQVHLDRLRAQAIKTGFGQTCAMEK